MHHPDEPASDVLPTAPLDPDSTRDAREPNARSRGGAQATMADIAAAIHAADKLVIATHENPDGDAIGSVRSMQLVLKALGKDVVAYVPRAMVPKEYEFIRPDDVTGDTPSDINDRVLLCLDCGNSSRLANDDLFRRARQVLNVDHHADNTDYGDYNVVRGDAACATQLVYALAKELGVPVTRDIATAIYVGLVTDTGRFQYSNTTPEAFLLAAELVRLGVDVHDVFREIYERMEYCRLKLLAKGLHNARRYDDGKIVVTYLTRDDFNQADADDDSAEGIVDFLRGVDGALVAVMLRDLEGGELRKGSLRTTRDDMDVSAIARTYNGGGHRQAAGFTTEDDVDTVVERIREHVRMQHPEVGAAAETAGAGS